ncbi:MAG: hypothetical protein E6G22_07690 [Actinobacteria bacterium]|nr:MAG: hypothetical protein E6G22_07690 [Actinomycetota bacterium]
MGSTFVFAAVAASSIALAASESRIGPRHVSHCPTRPSSTRKRYVSVVKSRRISVYQVANNDYAWNFVCHIPTRTRTPLLEEPIWVFPPDTGYVPKHTVVFARDWVAFSWTDSDAEREYFGVDVVDARHGREGMVDFYSLQTDPGFHRINRIVLRKTGVLAWSTRHRILRCRERCRDRALKGSLVRPKLLASGPKVVGRSLRGTKHGITWLEGRRRHFARL